MLLDLIQPRGDIIEGLFLSNIIDQDNAIGSFIVSRSDGLESLLTGGIPDVEFEFLVIDLLYLLSTFRILKSTPMVGRNVSWKMLSENRSNIFDFPTEESPMIRIFMI